MKLVVSEQKTGKSYNKIVDNAVPLFGKKIGETIELSSFGLNGYEAKITGGSDNQGFPMKPDLIGTARKKVFITRDKRKGTKKRVSRAGNTVSQNTSQLNILVTKQGIQPLSELIVSEKKVEGKKSIKEEMIKESLEVAGTASAAEQMAKEEFKKGEKKR